MKLMSLFRRTAQTNSFVELTDEQMNLVSGGVPSIGIGEGIITAFKPFTPEERSQWEFVRDTTNGTLPGTYPGYMPNLSGYPPGRGRGTAGRLDGGGGG